MLELSTSDYVVAALSALLLGFSKTGLPGAGILAIPLMASILPAKLSTGVVLPMLVMGDIVAVAWYRRHAVWGHLFRVIPFAVAGILIGYVVMGRITDRQLQPAIGAIILIMLALHVWRSRRPGLDERLPTGIMFAGGTGLLAGVTTMMANAAGPIMTIYLLAMRLPKSAFIGTGAWYFFMLNLFKIPFSMRLGLITPDTMAFNLRLMPLIFAGAALGILAARRIPERTFGMAVQILAAAAALRLLCA
ncbi:MAG: sulfite exporter TauE/SafE family protein [Kiritimatiellae bacterium]|nr:sulfite exporter TauE/SafE family protein [Kiritimatiellia bacterium]